MEPERAYPPPAFPVCLNIFYKSKPHNFKEIRAGVCEHFVNRDFLSKQIIIHRRFPRLNIDSYSASASPMKNFSGYLGSTAEAEHKIRSISQFSKNNHFVPCNSKKAKEAISRKLCGFEGNPYDDPKMKNAKEHQDSVNKRISGHFKSGMKGSFLSDSKNFLNSINTFETFDSADTSQFDARSMNLLIKLRQ